MLDTKDFSLKQISIIEIEKVIAEALETITKEKYEIEIGNLDFKLEDFKLLTKINITIKEKFINYNETEKTFLE